MNDQVREAITFNAIFAGMMELADMRDLGSRAAMRWGSNPHARTNEKAVFDSKKFRKQPFVF